MNTNNPSTTNPESRKNAPNTQFDSKAYSSTAKSESGFQDKIMTQIRELGDSLERAGEKIERSGWEKIGHAISSLGNSLEHLRDKSAPGLSKNSATKVGGNDSQAV